MRESVRNLRNCNCSIVDKQPGCYKWWFREECVRGLLNPLDPHIDYNRLIHDGNGFVALYIGIVHNPGRTLYQRAKWHIIPIPHHANRRVGLCPTVSTLRISLSALLGLDVTLSEQIVNDFIDKYCEWEWTPTATGANAKLWECQELTKNYYPLNIQENYVVDEATKARLKELRKLHKK